VREDPLAGITLMQPLMPVSNTITCELVHVYVNMALVFLMAVVGIV
jgi:hypothetical protein